MSSNQLRIQVCISGERFFENSMRHSNFGTSSGEGNKKSEYLVFIIFVWILMLVTVKCKGMLRSYNLVVKEKTSNHCMDGSSQTQTFSELKKNRLE